MFKRISNWTNIGIGTRSTMIQSDDDEARTVAVNPMIEGGKRLSYSEYLRLSTLLSSQVPATTVPDERVFIITHQAMELTFRLCLFDLYIIAETLERLSNLESASLKHLSLFRDELDSDSSEASFWRPARTAATRLRLAGEVVLPNLLSMIGRADAATFSNREFAAFRGALEPASGFQSVQFRLLELAFGKANLLKLPVFPVDVYVRNYKPTQLPDSCIAPVQSPTFLGRDPHGGLPGEPEITNSASQLSEIINKVLARLAQAGPVDLEPPSCTLISTDQCYQAVNGLQRIFSHHLTQASAESRDHIREGQRQSLELFRTSLEEVVRIENAHRETLTETRRGAYALQLSSPECVLIEIINSLIAADDAFFGSQEASLLGEHQKVAMTRIRKMQSMAGDRGESTPEGTGGGGPPYLAWRRRYLVPLFPMLPGYRGLEDAETLSWIE